MAPHAEEFGDAADEDEPADNHEDVGHPLATGDLAKALSAVGDIRLLELVRVGVGRGSVAVGAGHRGRFAVGGALHVEAVLDEGDAQAGAGAVLGCVGRVEEVGEEEADELE